MFKHKLGFTGLMVSFATLLYSSAALALTGSTNQSRAGTASYLFIDNQIDNEYLISSMRENPRFRGPNKWSKLSKPVALGQIGFSGYSSKNTYTDIWIENPLVPRPMLGLYCHQSAENCPSTGTIFGELTDDKGVYKALTGTSIAGGTAPIVTISPELYEFARSAAVNSKHDFLFNFCTTRIAYDLKAGKCADMDEADARWWSYELSILKVGHLNLSPTGGFSEIEIASDGSSQIKSGHAYCQNKRVSKVDGVACKVIKFNYQTSQNPTMYVSMELDPNVFGQYQPEMYDIRFSANGSYWWNWGDEISFSSLFAPYNSEITVFMSNRFFEGLIQNGISLTDTASLFNFRLKNLNLPAEEAYHFSAATSIKISPRDYGLSIVSVDGASRPKASGKIGSKQPPIELNYRVTLSAPRFADTVTAYVMGEQIEVDGLNYCSFETPDRLNKVPIPAELAFTHANGQEIANPITCGSEVVDMTHAKWKEEPWTDHQGTSYSTNLKLKFLMNDLVSQQTSIGEDWMGVVTADGTVHIKAQWIGIDD